jgi:hypothetical protein
VFSHSNGDVLADTNAERAAVSALWHTDGNRHFYSHSSAIHSNADCNNPSSQRDANYHAGSYADSI